MVVYRFRWMPRHLSDKVELLNKINYLEQTIIDKDNIIETNIKNINDLKNKQIINDNNKNDQIKSLQLQNYDQILQNQINDILTMSYYL